jgi:hypothetical protein
LFIGSETRQLRAGAFQLTIRFPNGLERVERFADQAALLERQRALDEEFAVEGWTGPHGWIL